MYQEERLLAILDFLKENKKISVEEICYTLNVSRDTARRDLVKLEENNAIIRTRGGAMLPETVMDVKDYLVRLHTVSSEKRMIGKKAASLISNGDRLILDTSTTVQSCAEHIPDLDCTVITNSINQADILSSRLSIHIHLLGGELQREHRYLYGSSAIEKLSHYFVDKAFLGVVGISSSGLFIVHEEDGMIKRQMIKQAEQVIVLADHTKIGVTGYFKFAELNEIDLLITDKQPNHAFCSLLKKNNIQLLVTELHTQGD